jgi:uncharacterized protein
MVITLDEILDKGLTVREPVSRDLLSTLLAEGEGTGFSASADAELHADLHKVSGGVLLEGDMEVQLSTPCNRCLTDVRLTLPLDFTLNLVPKASLAPDGDEDGDDDEAGQDAGSFVLEDADREVFDGKKIDLDPIIREQVLLALPMHAVCKEACKGLCGMCGQNLNEVVCGCETKSIDLRLAALKNIKLS